MQLYADIYLLLNYSTCLGRPSRPSSGVHKTVAAASGTDHTIWEASRPSSGVHKTVVAASGTDHTIWKVCFPDSMICTRGCSYSFMFS